LMGIWDHFYPNSIFGSEISTHYVNLPHFMNFESKPPILLDGQHGEFDWFDLDEIAGNGKFHSYMQAYANYLINNKIKNDND
jgi:colanic acid biosynthesis protein WcaH